MNGKKPLERKQQPDPDRDRIANTYRECLRLIGIYDYDSEQLKESTIRKAWGIESNRSFIRRVMDFFKSGTSETDKPNPPSLTLNRLVGILSSIDSYLLKKSVEEYNQSSKNISHLIPAYLSVEDKKRVIELFSKISLEEKRSLGLSTEISSLLDEIEGEIVGHNLTSSHILKTNRYSLKPKSDKTDEPPIIKDEIDRIVNKTIEEKFPSKIMGENEMAIEQIRDRVRNEVEKEIAGTEFLLGLDRDGGYLVSEEFKKDKSRYPKIMNFIRGLWSEPISEDYIHQLTVNILEHQKITSIFPVYLKFVEVQKVRPLPLIESTSENILENSLVSNKLIETYERGNIEVKSELVKGLARRYSYRVKVHFFIILEEDGVPQKYEFYESASGSSSIITLIRKAINRLLLWDIECLKRYFPVAQELFGREDRYGYGDTVSTIDAKVAVRLIYRDKLQESVNSIITGIDEERAFNSYIDGDLTVWERYCDFDTINCITNAEIYARLRVIQNSCVNPQTYLKQLHQKFNEKIVFDRAKDYLYNYPFCFWAARNHLENNLLKDYRTVETGENNRFKFESQNEAWSNIAYNAHLFLVEAYIRQGEIEQASDYLKALEDHLPYFGCLIAANYYLVKAELTYKRTDISRSEINSSCTDYLELAKKKLLNRSLLFLKVNEFSQGSTYPFHSYLARVFALEARLILYYPQFLNRNDDRKEIIDAIAMLQTARINAARDGNSYYYAQITLFQSCCFLMQAYYPEISSIKNVKFSREECIEWAENLLDHALVCFSEFSDRAYQSYTDRLIRENEIDEEARENDEDTVENADNNKKEIETDAFFDIQPLPSITPFLSQKTKKTSEGQNVNKPEFNNEDDIIVIKAKYLRAEFISKKLKEKHRERERRYQLFGQHAAYYFFAKAFYLTCKQEDDEKEIEVNLKKAINLFLYSLGTALGCECGEDGNFKINRSYGNRFKVIEDERNSSIEYAFKIRGIYLYCMREIAGFCKVFISLCQFILNPNLKRENIESYFADIHQDSEYVTGDRETNNSDIKYNLHLEKHFELVKELLVNYELEEGESIEQRRERMLPKFFRALRRYDE